MQIIKEVFIGSSSNRVFLRTDSYSNTLEYILFLVGEARKDFDFKESQCVISVFGQRQKMFGIEIRFDKSVQIPDSYTEIGGLKYTL